ncbi:type II secretion system inner membrane protein GspF [Anaeromyxobacter sp. Fw109-5]|uniref:type II secretion system inner membrane protein GspF n=1 Tax=Anaeromyxobacter sp. (strain Fw109-5) TaxID=404589 RepID=UPI0000ED780B|nr:type II secretion system inner membrane protein GspF [Anaeromyxobacter sp. Fw109-5]ABS24941.1 general secretion pathway protein F [Anaeromyxobacter sp. Fw109-5]
MPVFQYKALNAAGKAVQGLKEADSPRTLRANLRREGVFLTEVIGEAQAKAQAKREVNVRRWMLGRVGARDLAVATRQLAVLAHAGIPLVEALTALVDQVEHERLKRVLGDVKQRVNEGSALADALAAHPRVFSTLYVNMIRAGESSGALEIVLVRLADFTESQARLRSKIAGTMAYPIAMMVIGTLIMGILFTVVIPKITQIFDNTNATLPWYTAVTIGISSFAARWWWAILLAVAATGYGLARWRRTPAGRGAWDRAVLRAPILGPIVRQVAIGRFARTLSTLLKSGVPLLTAMDIVKNILGNVRLAEVVEQARDAIREGESIAAPLKRSGEFPPLVYHMVAIGERSGALEEMLANVADAYEDQVETTIAALTSLLEPVMIVAMGGVVAFIVFSVLMPILQINNLAGG